jgi:hypothetical protein
LLATVGALLVFAAVAVVFVRRDPFGVVAAAGLISVGAKLVVASAFYSRLSGEVGPRWKLTIAPRRRDRRDL